MRWSSVHSFRRANQLADKRSLLREADSSLTSCYGVTTVPKEGLSGASFTELTHTCQSGFTQGRDVDFIPGQLAFDEGRSSSMRSVSVVSVKECADVPSGQCDGDGPYFLSCCFVSTVFEGSLPAGILARVW